MSQKSGYDLFNSDQLMPFLKECQDFREAEFGPDVAIPLSQTERYIADGVNFYAVYGALGHGTSDIRALMHAFLISEAEHERMLKGKNERELEPFSPWKKAEEGRAVLWIASCMSMQMGGVARVLSSVMDEVEKHPFREDIVKMAAFVTGPKSYALATMVGMTQRPENYDGSMPFFEVALETLVEINRRLPQIWSMTMIKDYMRESGNRKSLQTAVREMIASRHSSQ